MSKSSKLRVTHTAMGGGNAMNNPRAKKNESTLMTAVGIVQSRLVEEGYPVEHYKSVKISEFRKCINPKSFFKPDGGFLYITLPNGNKYHLCASEAKHQGTNVLRILEGKKPQAKGNAIERAYKNFLEIALLFQANGQKTTPYVVFASGCDFAGDSTIIDRAGAMAGSSDNLNQVVYTRDDFGTPRGTVMIREEVFSVEEQVKVIYQICKGQLALLSADEILVDSKLSIAV